MLLDHESSRLAALREYDVLDSPKEEEFDRVTLMGARLFDVAISCITMVDKDRFFFKSGFGSDVENMDRQAGFCDTTIQREGVYCIEDTTLDPSVKDHPLVSDAPHIKSYAGTPLITREGYAIGTLCVMDPRTRSFSDVEKMLLRELSEFVMFHLDRRRLRIEAERREKNERDLQKLESLGMLAGGIAHDFNNLLVGVLGNASLAARTISRDNPVQEQLTGIIRAADQASELTDQLLAYAGQRPMSPKAVELGNLVTNMTPLLRSSIAKDVSLRVNQSADLPAAIGDPTQLRQIILNLVTNASEAYNGAPGTIDIKLTKSSTLGSGGSANDHAANNEGGYIRIDVKDTGSGMDRDTLNSVFSPFFSTKATSRGLGMSIVQRIVRGHGGDIQVESELGKGCTVSVWLEADTRRCESEPVTETKRDEIIAGNGTVLIVDDEALVLEMTVAAIESFGFDAYRANDGDQAIECLKANGGADALILDATLPGMNSDSMLDSVRRYWPDIPTIITSGHHIDEVASRFDDFEDLVFLQKPWTLEQLSSAIQEAMPVQNMH